MITFTRKIPNKVYVKTTPEWFRIILPNGKRLTLHRSCYKFKSDAVGNLYPYLELETAIKKSKYLIRQWRHRRKR